MRRSEPARGGLEVGVHQVASAEVLMSMKCVHELRLYQPPSFVLLAARVSRAQPS